MCTRALELQLSACLSRAPLRGMVLADHNGMCLAASGHQPADEIAAYMAIAGRKMENFEGLLPCDSRSWNVRFRRFHIHDCTFYVAAVGGGGEDRASELQRSISGVRRIYDRAAA